jgi:tRNA(Leu) C34 or U34 (ribose-2'-O)-methylase TrmL
MAGLGLGYLSSRTLLLVFEETPRRSLNLSNGVAAVVFEAWRQIGVLVAAP